MLTDTFYQKFHTIIRMLVKIVFVKFQVIYRFEFRHNTEILIFEFK